MTDEKLEIVEKISDNNILAFRNTTSVAVDFENKTLKLSDLNYSFEEVLSIAKKVEKIQGSAL